MKKEQIIDKITTKQYAYKQFLAAVLYNSDDTAQEIKDDLLQKYGESIKL